MPGPLGHLLEEVLEALGRLSVAPLREKEMVFMAGGLLEPLLPCDKLPEAPDLVHGHGLVVRQLPTLGCHRRVRCPWLIVRRQDRGCVVRGPLLN